MILLMLEVDLTIDGYFFYKILTKINLFHLHFRMLNDLYLSEARAEIVKRIFGQRYFEFTVSEYLH